MVAATSSAEATDSVCSVRYASPPGPPPPEIVAPSVPITITSPPQPTATPMVQASPGHHPVASPVLPLASAPANPGLPPAPPFGRSGTLGAHGIPANHGFCTSPQLSHARQLSQRGTIIAHSTPFEPVVRWQMKQPVATPAPPAPCTTAARNDVHIHDFGLPGAPVLRAVRNGNFRFSESSRSWQPMD